MGGLREERIGWGMRGVESEEWGEWSRGGVETAVK